VHDAVPTRAEALSAGLLRQQDVVLLATDHDAFDFELILESSPLIVDTRGRFLLPDPKVVKA
jgi:UDP-N-acetyl-D-glucosamine dehydrogenase